MCDKLDGEYNPHSYICEFCTNYLGKMKCSAYPDIIPMDIWNNTKGLKICNPENKIGYRKIKTNHKT